MVTIGICDDMEEHRERIKKKVEEYYFSRNKDYKVLVYDRGDKAIEEIEMLDLLILDIEMPVIDGINVKNTIVNKNCRIIFVTNYEQRVYEAFGKNVIAFIKKDELDKLFKILDKIETEEADHKLIYISGTLYDTYKIEYVEAEGSYINIYESDEKYFECLYLSEFLKRVDKRHFLKIHKSYVVNLRYVRKIDSKGVLLENRKILPLSRIHRDNVKAQFLKYIREQGL